MFVIGFYLLLTQVAHVADGKPSPPDTPKPSPAIEPSKAVISRPLLLRTQDRRVKALSGVQLLFALVLLLVVIFGLA